MEVTGRLKRSYNSVLFERAENNGSRDADSMKDDESFAAEDNIYYSFRHSPKHPSHKLVFTK